VGRQLVGGHEGGRAGMCKGWQVRGQRVGQRADNWPKGRQLAGGPAGWKDRHAAFGVL
jgi:hypothetical protein